MEDDDLLPALPLLEFETVASIVASASAASDSAAAVAATAPRADALSRETTANLAHEAATTASLELEAMKMCNVEIGDFERDAAVLEAHAQAARIKAAVLRGRALELRTRRHAHLDAAKSHAHIARSLVHGVHESNMNSMELVETLLKQAWDLATYVMVTAEREPTKLPELKRLARIEDVNAVLAEHMNRLRAMLPESTVAALALAQSPPSAHGGPEHQRLRAVWMHTEISRLRGLIVESRATKRPRTDARG